MTADGSRVADSSRPSAAIRIVHPVLAAFAVWLIVSTGVGLGVVALFTGPVAVAFLAVVPVVLALALAGAAKLTLGRFRVGTSILLSATLCALAVTGVVGGHIADAFPAYGIMAVGPVVALATIPLSLIQHRGWMRLVGVLALLGSIVLLAVGPISAEQTRQANAAAEEQREFEAQLGASVVPYSTSNLSVSDAQVGQDTSVVRGSLADDDGETTITTTRLWTADDLDGQLCSLARFAVGDFADAVPCVDASAGVVQATSDGVTATAMAPHDDRAVTVLTDTAETGLRAVRGLEPLDRATMEKWFRVQWDRDKAP